MLTRLECVKSSIIRAIVLKSIFTVEETQPVHFMTNSKTKVPFFDRDTTSIIKGIALIMMFVYHFFAFPIWWGRGISYSLIEKLSLYFGPSLQLCVPIFCFITGYFYFFNKSKSYKYSFFKITDILITYWVVFFLFAIIATVFVEYNYAFWNFIAECFALKRPTMYFCWYVNFYIIFILLLPLITKIMSKDIHIDLFLSLILIPNIFRVSGHFVNNSIASELIRNQEYWLSCVLIGYVWANYGLFEKLLYVNRRLIKNEKMNIILIVITAFCVSFGRVVVSSLSLKFKYLPGISINMDVAYTPIFIYAVVYICNTVDVKMIKKVLIIIGKYSLLMWFVSCIFFNNCKNIFQPILYLPRNPALVTIWGLFMCFSVSFLLDKVIKKLQKYKNKLLRF